jgi:translation elongation factor EF-G
MAIIMNKLDTLDRPLFLSRRVISIDFSEALLAMQEIIGDMRDEAMKGKFSHSDVKDLRIIMRRIEETLPVLKLHEET